MIKILLATFVRWYFNLDQTKVTDNRFQQQEYIGFNNNNNNYQNNVNIVNNNNDMVPMLNNNNNFMPRNQRENKNRG